MKRHNESCIRSSGVLRRGMQSFASSKVSLSTPLADTQIGNINTLGILSQNLDKSRGLSRARKAIQ